MFYAMRMHPHINRAIEVVGGGIALATSIGRKPQFVSALRHGRRPIPADLCPLIEQATEGAVRCEDLRPDVAWHVLRKSALHPGQQVEEAQCSTL